ncbi:hypothetical protein F0562_032218 [Nyssa sinensis]|uniref:Uncharacterized protein n=1 Tax=Nyssa sinensis TaxID=561372 RepID=A0A5J5B0D1_9ASTE|nr:hypothetical protein F0562_032218 [Nyssa sinensis]
MVPETEEEISSSDDDSLWSDLQEVVERAMADTSAGCSGSKLMNEARGPGDVVCTTVISEQKRMVEGRNEKSRTPLVSVPGVPVQNGMLRVVTDAQWLCQIRGKMGRLAMQGQLQ